MLRLLPLVMTSLLLSVGCIQDVGPSPGESAAPEDDVNVTAPACAVPFGGWRFELDRIEGTCPHEREFVGLIVGPVPEECTGEWKPEANGCTYTLERSCELEGETMRATAYIDRVDKDRWKGEWSSTHDDCQATYDLTLTPQ